MFAGIFPLHEDMLTTGVAHKLRADQVTIEEYRSNPAKYTADIPPGPKPEVASSAVHKVKVTEPEGEIDVKVYVPTQEAVDAGRLDTASGLPAHVNFHGGNLVRPQHKVH